MVINSNELQALRPGFDFPVYPVFHSFCFLMYYLLLCASLFFCLHSVHSVLMLGILYSVLLMYYCSVLVIVYVTLPLGIGPIAVGNKYIHIFFFRIRGGGQFKEINCITYMNRNGTFCTLFYPL
jgi:hypothetical protein